MAIIVPSSFNRRLEQSNTIETVTFLWICSKHYRVAFWLILQLTANLIGSRKRTKNIPTSHWYVRMVYILIVTVYFKKKNSNSLWRIFHLIQNMQTPKNTRTFIAMQVVQILARCFHSRGIEVYLKRWRLHSKILSNNPVEIAGVNKKIWQGYLWSYGYGLLTECNDLSHSMTKPTKGRVRSAKIQISLGTAQSDQSHRCPHEEYKH